MSYRTQLFRTENPYDLPSTEALFFRAMKENCIFHYEHCGEYRKILDSRGFSPADMNGYEGLCRLPFLPTLLFKKHELYSLPSRRMLIQATSSGTSGMASRIGFETSGLWCGLQMVLKIIRRRRLLSPRPAHYMILGYQPSKGNETAVTKTAFGATLFAPALSRTYALRKKDGQYKADPGGGTGGNCEAQPHFLPGTLYGLSVLYLFFAPADGAAWCPCNLRPGVKNHAGWRLEAILCRAGG